MTSEMLQQYMLMNLKIIISILIIGKGFGMNQI
jgi:hypothetical protein